MRTARFPVLVVFMTVAMIMLLMIAVGAQAARPQVTERRWVGLVHQSDQTLIPEPVVLVNELDTLTWTRHRPGVFSVTVQDGGLPQGRTAWFTGGGRYIVGWVSEGSLTIETRNEYGVPTDGLLMDLPLEIRVYGQR